jgi:predicted nucleotidyltransferase
VATWPELSVGELLRRLCEARVDFVVVGGLAVVLHGYVRTTKDLDICYAGDDANLEALGDVLVAIEARLRGIEDDIPFVPDGRTLRHTQILTLETSLGWVDLLVDPAGSPSYATLRERATSMHVSGHDVQVASVDDLLAMKRASNRPTDQADIEALEKIQRVRRHPDT